MTVDGGGSGNPGRIGTWAKSVSPCLRDICTLFIDSSRVSTPVDALTVADSENSLFCKVRPHRSSMSFCRFSLVSDLKLHARDSKHHYVGLCVGPSVVPLVGS